MLASNGQVAYLGYDPKSDWSGELFSVLFLSRSPSLSLPLYRRSVPRSSYFSQLGSAHDLHTRELKSVLFSMHRELIQSPPRT